MSETIPVLVSLDQTKGVFGGGGFPELADVPIDKLKSNLADLVANLSIATAGLVETVGGLSLTEMEVGVEITAEGGVSLIGTVKAGATATVKLTFCRHK